MATYKCPGCGAAYNGRRCRQCLYQRFSEEISCGTHTHRGEPLVIRGQTRRPVPKKDPFGCEKKTKKQEKPFVLQPGMLIAAIYLLFLLFRLVLG